MPAYPEARSTAALHLGGSHRPWLAEKDAAYRDKMAAKLLKSYTVFNTYFE